MATWDDIRAVAATLPETVESSPRELHGLLRDSWLARVPKKLARAYLAENP